MRILLINDYNFKFGGAEELFFKLEKELIERGHKVKTFGADKKRLNSYFSRIYSFKWAKLLENEIKSFSPDLINIHNCSRVLSTSILRKSKKLNIPIVLTVHDNNYFYPKLLTFSPFYFLKSIKIKIHRKDIQKIVDMIIAPSKLFSEKLQNIFNNKIVLIHNGINIPKIKTSYKKEILFVGRLHKVKGLQTIIESLNKLKDYEILVLGDGPLKNDFEKKYKNIKFLGFQNPENYYKEASILVYPSIVEENCPLASLEAMSYSLCVIASDIGGIPEQIQHMKTGLLFKPGDEQDFKEKLDYLLKNPKEIKRMGKNAREYVKKNFSWVKCVKEYEKVYKEVIKEFKEKK